MQLHWQQFQYFYLEGGATISRPKKTTCFVNHVDIAFLCEAFVQFNVIWNTFQVFVENSTSAQPPFQKLPRTCVKILMEGRRVPGPRALSNFPTIFFTRAHPPDRRSGAGECAPHLSFSIDCEISCETGGPRLIQNVRCMVTASRFPLKSSFTRIGMASIDRSAIKNPWQRLLRVCDAIFEPFGLHYNAECETDVARCLHTGWPSVYRPIKYAELGRKSNNVLCSRILLLWYCVPNRLIFYYLLLITTYYYIFFNLYSLIQTKFYFTSSNFTLI